jgi:hypothetical protein
VEAVVAAPGSVVGGLVVVEGVGTAVAAARAAVGARAAAAGMRRWPVRPGAVAAAAGLLFTLAAAGVVLGALAGLLTGALAGAVSGCLQASEQNRRLRPGSSGWPKRWPQVGQVR